MSSTDVSPSDCASESALGVPRSPPWFPWSDPRASLAEAPAQQARASHPGSPGRDGVAQARTWSYHETVRTVQEVRDGRSESRR
jgi:hypothetical protein